MLRVAFCNDLLAVQFKKKPLNSFNYFSWILILVYIPYRFT